MGWDVKFKAAPHFTGNHVRGYLGDSPGSFPSNPILIPPPAAVRETLKRFQSGDSINLRNRHSLVAG